MSNALVSRDLSNFLVGYTGVTRWGNAEWRVLCRSSVLFRDRQMLAGVGGGDAHLDRGGRDGHGTWICRAEQDGTNGARGESVFRAGVRVSGKARRSDQVAVVGRRRTVPVRETTGARKIHLAASSERNGFVDAGAVVDAAGRHRLAAAGAQLRAADGGVSALDGADAYRPRLNGIHSPV